MQATFDIGNFGGKALIAAKAAAEAVAASGIGNAGPGRTRQRWYAEAEGCAVYVDNNQCKLEVHIDEDDYGDSLAILTNPATPVGVFFNTLVPGGKIGRMTPDNFDCSNTIRRYKAAEMAKTKWDKLDWLCRPRLAA